MASAMAEIFLAAAQAIRSDSRRRGNLVQLDEPVELILCGDLHGHRNNLSRIVDYAALPQHPQRVLVLQEIVHGPLDDRTGLDRSVELLMRVARMKASSPNLLLLLGNHDIAQVTGNEIAKEGRGVCKSFSEGMAAAFGAQASEVSQAVYEFLQSLPLAIRAQNSLLISHSLPSPARMELAGTAILESSGYTQTDLRRGGGAYEWTWGRNQSPQQLEELAAKLAVEFFVLGHRHSAQGFEMIPSRAITITSDNDRACLIHVRPGDTLTYENVMRFLKPVATLGKSNG